MEHRIRSGSGASPKKPGIGPLTTGASGLHIRKMSGNATCTGSLPDGQQMSTEESACSSLYFVSLLPLFPLHLLKLSDRLLRTLCVLTNSSVTSLILVN